MKNKTRTAYPLAALRAVVLHVQQLAEPNGDLPPPDEDRIVDLVRALGYLQVDTLHVVQRAHYAAVWSRLGAYDTNLLDGLVYRAGNRRLYEGWGHAASLIPLEHFRYHRWRDDSEISFNPSFRSWVRKKGNRELAQETLERIRAAGGLRLGDFERKGAAGGPWFDWRPSKMALEALFTWGDLMISDRVNFHRVYDLRERVLPAWVDTTPVSPDEARRFLLEEAAKALGVFELNALTLYAYMRAKPAREIVQSMVEDGQLIEIRGESVGGARRWWIHCDHLELLERAADGGLNPERTTFLSPFDSLFWARGRDEKLWGFRHVLEAYKPAQDRVYGYFCFPILHKDRLIGRFDPRLDRKTGVMHLHAVHLEPGVEPNDSLVGGVAGAMRDFLAWHGANDLRIKKSDPASFGRQLLLAL